MATLDELRLWCETSRKLLKTTTLKVATGTSRELKKHLRAVPDLLAQIAGDRRLVKFYAECLAEYERLQKQLQTLAAQKQNASEKERNKVQELMTVKFTELEEKLKAKVVERNKERAALEALSKARGEYMADYFKAMEAVELLKVLPKGNPVNVANELTKIHEQTKQDTVDAYGIGRNALKLLMPKIKHERELAERLRQAELEQWEKRPAAQQRLDEAQAQLTEIEGMVGVEAAAKQYRDILAAARQLAADDAWASVITKLDELKKLKTPAVLTKESQIALKSLTEVPRYSEGLGHITELKKLVTPEEGTHYERAFQEVGNLVLAQGIKSETQRLVADAVENLKGELQLKTNLHTALEDLARELTNLMGEARELVAPLNLLGEQAQFDNFAALLTAKRLEAAWELGETLKETFEQMLPDKRRDQDTWLKKKFVAKKVAQLLEALRQSPCEVVRSRAPAALGYASEAVVQQLEAEHDWTRLVDFLGKAQGQLKELTAMDDSYRKLDTLRGEADGQITQKAESLTPLIQAVENAVNKARAEAGLELFDSTKHYVAERAAVRATWNHAKANVAEQKALEAARDEALRVLGALAEALTAAKDPSGIARLVELRQQELAEPQFEKLWLAFEKLQQQVQGLDNKAAQTLANHGAKVRSTAPVNWKQGVTDLSLVVKEAQAVMREGTQAQTDERQAIVTLGQEVLNEINRVKKATKNAKSFQDAFTALGSERDELLLLGQSTSLDALKEARQGLVALKARATKFAPEAQGTGISIDKVMEALQRSIELLENARETLEKNNPRALVTLANRLPTLKTEVYAAEPEDGMTKVAAFTGQVTEAEVGANKVIQTRTEFEQLLPTTKAALKTFTERGVAPEYAKTLKARLEAAEKLAKDAHKLYEALSNLKTIDGEVNAASRDLKTATAKEGGVREQQHEDEKTQLLYERTLKQCEGSAMKEAQASIKSHGGDQALMKELERMLGVARQSHKQGDLAKALEQVQLTVERARQITADPYGPAVGSRNNLPKDNQVWREALAAFEQTLDVVRDKTLQVAGTVHDEAKKKFESLLNSLKTKFDPNVFEGTLRALADPSADDNARRAAREAALNKVHSVQATLTGNPQIVQLLGNPAAKSEFSVAYRRMQSALARLDANISRCVR